MAAICQWLLCVLCAVGAVAFGVRLAGKDLRWCNDRLPSLILAAGVLAWGVAYGGSKPDPGPGPGPTPPAHTNLIIRIPVGIRADGSIMPYGAPLREAK